MADWYQRYGRGQVRGRDLRYILTTLLREAGRPLRVAELVVLCEGEGIVFTGRPSKVISDALRWEIGWRRVARLSRGVYRYMAAPRSTRYWIGRRVRQLRLYLAQLAAGLDVAFPWAPSWGYSQIGFRARPHAPSSADRLVGSTRTTLRASRTALSGSARSRGRGRPVEPTVSLAPPGQRFSDNICSWFPADYLPRPTTPSPFAAAKHPARQWPMPSSQQS